MNDNARKMTSGISLLTTGLISSGGESIEPVESIRKFAPRIYASQNRALTSNDYETLIPTKIYPEAESISVFGGEELIQELRNHVAKEIGPIAKPKQILVVAELPKTRSGKIMRRLLRDVAENRAVGASTTLADPNVMKLIQAGLNAGSSED